MGSAFLTRKGGGGATITFDNRHGLERNNVTSLSVARQKIAATTVGNYALFGGGYDGDSYSSTVDAHSTSLSRSTPTALSVKRNELAATTVGNYALFGGGYVGGSFSSTVDAYSTSLSRSTPTALSVGREQLAATTVGNYALFGGGYPAHSTVDAYNISLSRSTPTALSVGRDQLAATTVGDYALFGGGRDNRNNRVSTVDAYSFNNKVTIYPGAKYKFSGMSSEVTATEYKQIQVNTPINGYIKLKDVTLN